MRYLVVARAGEIMNNGFTVNITGDVDVSTDLGLIDKWAHLAWKLTDHRVPILYVCGSPDPYRFIDAELRSHGVTHVHHTKLSSKQLAAQIEASRFQSGSEWFRSPHLDTSPRVLREVAKWFKHDSSLAFPWALNPFRLLGLWEHPITAPTDTPLRNRVSPQKAAKIRLKKIHAAETQDKLVDILQDKVPPSLPRSIR